MCETGMISTISSYSSSIITSCVFASGMMTRIDPDFAAASILCVTPPTGSTSPRTDSQPVMARFCLIGTSSIAEITAVATVIEAESPSTPP